MLIQSPDICFNAQCPMLSTVILHSKADLLCKLCHHSYNSMLLNNASPYASTRNVPLIQCFVTSDGVSLPSLVQVVGTPRQNGCSIALQRLVRTGEGVYPQLEGIRTL